MRLDFPRFPPGGLCVEHVLWECRADATDVTCSFLLKVVRDV